MTDKLATTSPAAIQASDQSRGQIQTFTQLGNLAVQLHQAILPTIHDAYINDGALKVINFRAGRVIEGIPDEVNHELLKDIRGFRNMVAQYQKYPANHEGGKSLTLGRIGPALESMHRTMLRMSPSLNPALLEQYMAVVKTIKNAAAALIVDSPKPDNASWQSRDGFTVVSIEPPSEREKNIRALKPFAELPTTLEPQEIIEQYAAQDRARNAEARQGRL